MATYATLTSLMHILEQIQNHPRLPITIDKRQIESLCENISFLQDFLENYSHEGGCSEAQGHLETQIADAAYAAEDVIESHIVDRILAGEKRSEDLFYQALQTVIEDMDVIKKDVIQIQEKWGINDIDQQPRNTFSMSVNIGSSTVLPPSRKNTNTVLGFDDVLIEIMERLTEYQHNRQILPIVGMGGIGKTTLARNVYDNAFIVQHFPVRIWVTISQEYKFRDILLGALFCVTKTESDENLADFSDNLSHTSEDEIGRQLYQSLYGRRYLFIMDDMWTIEAWDRAKFFFPDDDNGSRIVITTRLSNVADHFNPNGFRMNFLDEDKSWDLFCVTVFQQDQCCHPELEENGKKIARNCKGLPLSIVVIGGLLANSEKTLEKWEYVAKNLNSIVNLENDEHCLKILSLSYNNLPVHLKPCFLYMGVFPEDEDIRVSWLVKLWVTEGFLKPIKAKSLEVVAEDYLNELIHRNLILVHKWGSSGKIKYCKIHDVLRDLCLREAKKEKFLCVKMADNLYTPEGMHCQRRIITHQSPSKENYPLNQALPSESQTRSLICDSNGVLPSLISRLLRVFKAVDKYSYVEAKGDYRYPLENVFQLVNSRFLAFRSGWNSNSTRNGRNSNSILPSSIHLLWNLQTLIVRDTWGNQTVAPPEIWEMSQLRHVEFEFLYLPNPPNLPIHDQGDGFVLRKLQTLMGIKNFKLSEEVMKRIPNVKKLQVFYEDYPEGWSSIYCLNNFGCLNKLESLACIFLSEKKPNHRIELLKNLAFPHSLKKLTLYDSCLLWEDLTRIGSLPHLQVLKLDFNSFHGPEWNPVEGEFQCLKFLLIVGCNDLRYWNADSTHFPRLEHLVLQKLFKLKEIPLDIGEIPTLQSIELEHCSDSAVISAKNIVEEQENLGNVGLHVQVRLLSKSELESLAFASDLNFKVET